MGDPACHLSSVCISCGRFLEGAQQLACPHCGELLDGGPTGVEGPVSMAGQVNTIRPVAAGIDLFQPPS